MSSMYLLRVGAPLIVGLLQIGLAIAIYRKKGSKDMSNNLFALVVLSVAGWAISTAFWQASPLIGYETFFITLTYLSASCIPYFFLLFTFNFPAERLRITRKELFLVTIPFVLVLLFVLLPHYVLQEEQKGLYEDSVLVPAMGYRTYSLFITGYFMFAFMNLFNRYRRTRGLLNIQARDIFLATFLPTVIGVTTNLFFPVLVSQQNMWFGPVATLLLFLIITRSMRRYRLFDLTILEYKNKLLALLPPDEAKKIVLFDARRYAIVGESAG